MRTSLVELASDHPGFNDPTYRQRRNEIAELARRHAAGTAPEDVEYAATETSTWTTIFDALTTLYPTHACREYLGVFERLGYRRDAIPQLSAVSGFLSSRTGFRLEPVAGLVSPRDFLAGLSRRVFYSTQYIRHHSKPHYTPEPDVVHELMGHAPMLAIEEFADLSQSIGRGAVGATDQQVEQLATLYWYTIEYGVLRQDGELRAYGAGLLSSFGELARALRGEPDIRPFDPHQACDVPYPITAYQPLLWEVPSIRSAFEAIEAFIEARRAH